MHKRESTEGDARRRCPGWRSGSSRKEETSSSVKCSRMGQGHPVGCCHPLSFLEPQSDGGGCRHKWEVMRLSPEAQTKGMALTEWQLEGGVGEGDVIQT